MESSKNIIVSWHNLSRERGSIVMAGFFYFLAFAAFAAFIVGLIKPQIMVFWGKKKTRGAACLYLIAMIVFLIIAGNNSSSVPTPANAKPSSSSMASSAVLSSASTAKSSAVTSKASPNVLTSDSIKAALKSANVANVDTVKLDGKTVTIIVYDKDILTVKSYLRQNQPHSAEAFKCVFGLSKNITKVIYQSDVSTTDAYGKSNRTTAQTNTLTKDQADKIADWQTFEYEDPSQYYSVVNFELAPESKISGLHAAWAEIYK
jgi:hypothetical protein